MGRQGRRDVDRPAGARVRNDDAPGQEVELTLPSRWNVSPRLAQAMKVIPGVEAVEAA